MKNIPVVFSTDNNYIMPLSVAIQSLKLTLSNDFCLNIYIFYEDLSTNSKNKLELLSDNNCIINFVNVSNYMTSKYYHCVGRLTKAIYYRLCACNILNEFKKIIYLDCDIIANKSISELYNININNYLIAGVYDEGLVRQGDVIANDYINSGVILFNVEKCNEFAFHEKCKEYIDTHPELPWMDQQVINEVCHGQIKNIDNKFDFMTFFVYDYKKQKSLLKEELKYQQLNKVEDIVLIHYTGQKPWNIKNLPLSDKWWKVVKTLPKELQKDIKNKYKPKKVYGKIGYFFHKIAVKIKLILSKGKQKNEQ